MHKLFKLPDFGSNDLNIIARSTYYLAASLILFSLALVILTYFVIPELLHRAVIITCFVILVSMSIIFLIRRHRLRTAGSAFTIFLWLIITTGAITTGTVSAPVFMGYMMIIMLGGLMLNRGINFLVAGLCSITVILIAAAQNAGWLPEPIDYSPFMQISVYIFFFIHAALLQSISTLNTSQLLEQAQKSEARYRSLLENIPAITYINNTTKNAQTEFISPQAETLLGYPHNAFTDDPLLWTKILHPDDKQRVMNESDRTAESGDPFNSEYRVITNDRKTLWLKDEARLVYDKNHTPLYWLGVLTDITALKKVEENQLDMFNAMTSRTNQLQTAAEVARAATSTLDLNGLLPDVVELIRNHFDYYYVGIFLVDEKRQWAVLSAASGHMGKQMLEEKHRLKAEDSSMIGWCIKHQQARIALDVGEDAVRFANPYLPLTRSEMALPLITHGEVIGAMTIQSEKPAAFSYVDITVLQTLADQVANAIENARLFTERVRLNKELETQNEELERFTYTVSHDLRAPLVTIRGFLGYLRLEAEAGDLVRFDKDMSRIANAVDKMQLLLNELLELSRVGRIANPPEIVPFGEIVEETVDLLSGPLEAGDIQLEIMDDFPFVYVDRLRVSEVMQNLLGNAIKFMGDQSNPIIEIGWQETDAYGKPIFYVRDNGMGIDPKYHERIFGLFNRLNPDIEGTGIGLTLVKRIIEIHGGRIWIDSGSDKGTTFLFTLPAPDK